MRSNIKFCEIIVIQTKKKKYTSYNSSLFFATQSLEVPRLSFLEFDLIAKFSPLIALMLPTLEGTSSD